MTKNLNLLSIFIAIAEERSLSKAAEKLGLSQPTMSYSLKKLREDFNDPLFVRASKGVVLTPVAKSLQPRIKELIAQAEQIFEQSSRRPEDYKGAFKMATTPYVEAQILKPLMEQIHALNPHASLKTMTLRGELPFQEIESGLFDVAIASYFTSLPEKFYMRTIGKDPYVAVLRKGHPYIKSRQRLEDYLQLKHIRIALGWNEAGRVDKVLQKKNLRREIVGQLGDFLAAPLLVEDSDFVLTLPSGLAALYKRIAMVDIVELPVKVEPLETTMIWHARTHQDAAQTWFRKCIADNFQKK
jgi:DNA-binding transcriptional LysR family regulator